MTRATILVTHLFGSGHLSRMLTLARALGSSGFDVQVVSGGMATGHLDTEGIDFVQLPPVRSDGSTFSRLLDKDSLPVQPDTLEQRKRDIVAALERHRPEALITELFPFGRRLLRDEFGVALQTARQLPGRPLVVASVRDIPAPPLKQRKIDETDQWLTDYYDAVLIHSDPKITPLEQNYPVTPTITRLVRYTGFMVPPKPLPLPAGADGEGEVVVTAGGGPTGRHLFALAVDAARIDPRRRRWRLLVGGIDGAEVVARLRAAATGTNAIVEPVRKDYRQMLTACAAAVGQCGYNTAIDWLQAGVPGVFVPFAESGEVEQAIRAADFAQRYGFKVIAEDDLTPQNLIEAVDAAIAGGRLSIRDVDLDGAAETGRILKAMLAERG